jgi:hypothetical protein
VALHTFGTAASSSLSAVAYGSSSPVGGSVGTGQLAPADLAAIAASIVSDTQVGASVPLGAPGPRGIVATGATHTNATLDTLVAVAGGGLATIHAGMLVLGVGIPAGTFVSAVTSGTAVVLSQAATASATGVKLLFANPNIGSAFSFNGQLLVPNRGVLKVMAGDVVAVDNTGWPILVSANAVGYSGSLWTFT